MRHRGKDFILEPLAVRKHAFLMTARAKIPGLAGVGQQVVPAALVAVEAGKAMMQIATGQESLEHFGLDRPMHEVGGIEFSTVSAHTLIEGLARGLRGR